MRSQFDAKFSDETSETVQRVGALESKLLGIATKYSSDSNNADELSSFIQELEQAEILANLFI